MDTDEEGVFANGDDIFAGQTGFGNGFIIQQGTVGAVEIFLSVSIVLISVFFSMRTNFSMGASD